MQKRRLEEQQQQRLITITLQEVNRLNSLCNNILLASQLDAGEYKISKNEVNVSELAKKVFNDFKGRNPLGQLTSAIENNLFVNGEELLLEMLMTNLLENAIKYSPKNSPVHVSLSKNPNGVSFVVKDKGPGIPEDERSKIFEKFYRVGNESTRTTKGTGLGLYLSKQIAKDHRAEIMVSDNGEKGSVFTVTFKT
jgi:signal transduction histidine kinase